MVHTFKQCIIFIFKLLYNIFMKHIPFTILCLLVFAQQIDIINLPLDERFTTRVAFLNLATLTSFDITSQPANLLPKLKQYSNPNQIADWFSKNVNKKQIAIISLEMYLYGGLIASRISNDTQAEISKRLDSLELRKVFNKGLKIYASAVVMRIPASDGDFEEPTYWANYGRLIYQFSFYTDKYRKTGDPSDYEKSQDYKQQIPQSVLSQFIRRRERNHNILKNILNRFKNSIKDGNGLFERLYITLDDNSQYGFNIAEADQLRSLVVKLNLTQYVLIYSGADQVPFTLLAKSTTAFYNRSPSIKIIYRNESTINLIPNYQGLPMSVTLNNQIKAAGGIQSSDSNIYLLVNNFNGPKQLQAPYQANDAQSSYTIFDKYICSNKTVGLIDNKYSNGADINFVKYFLQKSKSCKKNITEITYAGWNTNGNTIGTAVSNAIILELVSKIDKKQQVIKSGLTKYCDQCSPCRIGDYKCANSYFNILRILQDRDWQSILRQKLISYLQQVPTQNFNHLDADYQFYTRFTYKSLYAKSLYLFDQYGLDFKLKQIYYPWNRTFQIGIVGDLPQYQKLSLS